MRKLIMAAAIAVGAFAAMPSATIAAPVATQNAMTTQSDVEVVQYGRGEYRRDWRYSRRHWDRPGYGYGRRYHGPPPHARAYGRRNHYRY
jgi:hypothetical protein